MAVRTCGPGRPPTLVSISRAVVGATRRRSACAMADASSRCRTDVAGELREELPPMLCRGTRTPAARRRRCPSSRAPSGAPGRVSARARRARAAGRSACCPVTIPSASAYSHQTPASAAIFRRRARGPSRRRPPRPRSDRSRNRSVRAVPSRGRRARLRSRWRTSASRRAGRARGCRLRHTLQRTHRRAPRDRQRLRRDRRRSREARWPGRIAAPRGGAAGRGPSRASAASASRRRSISSWARAYCGSVRRPSARSRARSASSLR